jgi:lysophospholipase L1-like esterase
MTRPGLRTALLVVAAVLGAGLSTTPSVANAAMPCSSTASASTHGATTGAGRSVLPARVDLVAAAPPTKIWMAGDSTMQNPSGGVCPVGWGSQFGALFTSDATVVNRAVGGRSIQTWLYDPNVTSTMNSAGECTINPATYSTRWQEMLNTSTGMKAGDYLFIQFGINDSSTTCPRHVGPARYQELLTMMAKAALARGAHPILLTPVAAITCSGSTATTNRGFVTQTFAAGTANNVPVIDLQKLSVALYNSLKFCPNNADYTSGALGAFFCNDHTHFETTGARQIAAVVAKELRARGLPLAAYLR